MNNIPKNKKGFTLVEILAVIVLISLIIIIAVPSVKSISYKSKKKLFNTKVELTKEAVNLWGTNNKTCFTEAGGCNVLSECTGTNTITCTTTFGKLAENGIINYDEKVTKDGVKTGYVVNPVNSASLNDEELTVKLENDVVNTECAIAEEDGEHINRDEDEDATGEANLPNITLPNDSQNSNTAVLIINANGGKYNGKTGNTIINSKIGTNIELSTPVKENHRFIEWKITHGDGDITEKGVKIKSTSLEVQAQYEVELPEEDRFDGDPWSTIATNVREYKEKTIKIYPIGATKKINISGKEYTVRVANNSNYDCTLASKTACGFVVEFVDIVEKRTMNSGATNAGGWLSTAMRTYLNGKFKAKLPSDLQEEIEDTDTYVVSGHGLTDTVNFTSTDKIYLLSTTEVWGDGISYDTATHSTRQLDYYEGKEVTTSNYGEAIKNYKGIASGWWLRTAISLFSDNFFIVSSYGYWHSGDADLSYGLAPAFRIG